MEKEKLAIEKLITLCRGVEHGSEDFVSHCLGVYNILKEMQAPLHICLSGLYHSIYGTEYFKNNSCPSRENIVDIIGEEAENLVHTFCTIPNRNIDLLKNKLKFDERKHKDLCFIELANLTNQSKYINDNLLEELIYQYQQVLLQGKQFDGEDKIHNFIEVYDNFFATSELDWLNTYCLNANYNCEHSSSPLGHERDSRFSSNLSRVDFINLNLERVLQKIRQELKFDFFIGKYYLNHYSLFTSTARHTDSSFPNTFTILIFCNKYWEESWGGELKIYSENSKFNSCLNFEPGRIVLFDSRIEHKVLPLTMSAKKDRFTLALKCSNVEGLNNLIDMYGSENIVKIGDTDA
jgi:hypothetical protein